MANRYDITKPVADQLRAVRDDYLMATPDKQDTAYAVMTRAADTITDLLEALQEFSREYDGFENGDGHPCPTLAKARAAIAKATGAPK